jgi:hypothetical protein
LGEYNFHEGTVRSRALKRSHSKNHVMQNTSSLIGDVPVVEVQVLLEPPLWCDEKHLDSCTDLPL